jgi:gamma-glutamylcyclotransferase (GGCT)/AIG2-like uncharacterized protein YtfP
MVKLFVYGTLKANFHANPIITQNHGTFVRAAKTGGDFKLLDMGGFPGMVPCGGESDGVHGEIFEIPESAFEPLDNYECIDSGLFRRELITLEDGDEAWAYLFNRPHAKAKDIPGGVWR